jgi:hypothetical protein
MKQFLPFLVVFCIFFLCNSVSQGQMPGQVALNPKTTYQFVDPLSHFAGLRVKASGGNLTISYEPIRQVAVLAGTVGPLTPNVGKVNFWGYAISNGAISTPGSWPARTIEALRGIPVNVTFKESCRVAFFIPELIANRASHQCN